MDPLHVHLTRDLVAARFPHHGATVRATAERIVAALTVVAGGELRPIDRESAAQLRELAPWALGGIRGVTSETARAPSADVAEALRQKAMADAFGDVFVPGYREPEAHVADVPPPSGDDESRYNPFPPHEDMAPPRSDAEVDAAVDARLRALGIGPDVFGPR